MKLRRWFRFSLRGMFVLVTLLALWLAVQVNWVHQRRDFLKQECLGIFASEVPAPWSVRILGERGYQEILILRDPPNVDQILSKGRALFPETFFYESPGLRPFKTMAELEHNMREIQSGRRYRTLNADDRNRMVKSHKLILSEWKQDLATQERRRTSAR